MWTSACCARLRFPQVCVPPSLGETRVPRSDGGHHTRQEKEKEGKRTDKDEGTSRNLAQEHSETQLPLYEDKTRPGSFSLRLSW